MPVTGPSLPSSYPYSFPRFFVFGRRSASPFKSTRQAPTPNAIRGRLPTPGYRAYTYVPIGSSTPLLFPRGPPQQRRNIRSLVSLDERSPGTDEPLAIASTRLVHLPHRNDLARLAVPSHLAKAAALNCQGSAFEPARLPPCIPGLPPGIRHSPLGMASQPWPSRLAATANHWRAAMLLALAKPSMRHGCLEIQQPKYT
jgi:hypothetical protein